MDAVQEHALAVDRLKKWYKSFPEVTVVYGNHDLIPQRQAKEIGLPHDVYLRRLEEVYQCPDGWAFHNRISIDDVLYLHNAGSGKYAALNKAREQSMSVVAGHTHRNPGVIYQSNPSKMFFGMNVGCLVDKNAYAMRYSDQEITLGCGVVVDSEEAYFVPLKMD
jgi:UDP-2,3-diacylglucosamine pyrophosphatase LpxH